jgi:hypothetical protein
MSISMTAAALFALGHLAQAGTTSLPDDARLDPVRAQIEAVVARSTQAGLPSEIIVSKVREGLAKGVDPARIGVAAERLAQGLADARSFVVSRRGAATTSPELVRAVAEAKLAGVDLGSAGPLIDKQRGAADSARAVEVLTDLSRRGYPTGRASELVAELLARDPTAVGRLPSTLEVMRQEQALSQAESVDQIAQGLRAGGSLQSASTRAAAAPGRSGGAGKSQGKGNPGGAGATGFVPPGQLKKQIDARTPPGQGKPPGRPKK